MEIVFTVLIVLVVKMMYNIGILGQGIIVIYVKVMLFMMILLKLAVIVLVPIVHAATDFYIFVWFQQKRGRG